MFSFLAPDAKILGFGLLILFAGLEELKPSLHQPDGVLDATPKQYCADPHLLMNCSHQGKEVHFNAKTLMSFSHHEHKEVHELQHK